ncbi:MAG: 2-succinyl-5-enolpyruvyl-6-hydroxy-3-cyclohexene-1-carboxylic-acid synthase [Gemmatimonadota bacterium]
MSWANRNQLWAQVLVDELARAGVRHVCVAPGSRSTPLVLAAAARGDLHLHVHLDERSAGFFALGLAKASGVAAVVITTSGTAVANLLPAVVEASQSETPLLLVTADRPVVLRGADANQAIDQVRIFGGYARWFWECPEPRASERTLKHLRQVASRAVAASGQPEPGPVHLNVPFSKPLEPTPVPGDVPDDVQERWPLAVQGRDGGAPYTRVRRARPALDQESLKALATAVSRSSRGLLVAGPASDDARSRAAAERAAAITDFPLLADPLSGARRASVLAPTVIGGYDLFLRSPAVRSALSPDLIVRIGASPTSQPLLDWLESLDVPHLVIDSGSRWKDHMAVATEVLRADPLEAMDALAGALGGGWGHSGWNERWRRADQAAGAVLAQALAEEPFEGRIAHDLAEALPEGATLFVSNSMPIRDVDAFVAPKARALRILGNRGASGIDGIVSTALGVAREAGGPCAALLGDLAFAHDMNGLLAAREQDLQLVLVVVHNDGGGIFHRLPIRTHEPEFTRYFATPHGLDFRHAAALYDLPFSEVRADAMGIAVQDALAAGGVRILQVRSDRDANDRRQRDVAAAVQAAVERALSQQPS